MIVCSPVSAKDEAFIAALQAGDLAIDDLGESGGRFFRLERNEQLLGYGGFELYGENALLRSIVVPKDLRGQGNGSAIVEALLREIAKAGGRKVHLLTLSAATFFERLGFRRIEHQQAPLAIHTTRQASTICTSAELLTKAI